MRSAARLFAVVALLVSVNAAAACGKKIGPSEIPILATDDFTGTIGPGGTASHTFTVRYAFDFTEASVTVMSLTSVATGAAPNITIGIAFGNISQGVCTRAPSYTNPQAIVNQEQRPGDLPFQAGAYCVQIFDNPAATTVTEPLNYTLRVLHY
jgi:hypothetical protein